MALLDGCPDVEQRINEAPAMVKAYLVKEFGKLLDTERFLDGLDGNLRAGPGGEQRVERCLAIIRRIAGRA